MGERVSLCQNRGAAGWDGGIMCTVRIGTDYNKREKMEKKEKKTIKIIE